jgi:hypothetical protein
MFGGRATFGAYTFVSPAITLALAARSLSFTTLFVPPHIQAGSDSLFVPLAFIFHPGHTGAHPLVLTVIFLWIRHFITPHKKPLFPATGFPIAF